MDFCLFLLLLNYWNPTLIHTSFRVLWNYWTDHIYYSTFLRNFTFKVIRIYLDRSNNEQKISVFSVYRMDFFFFLVTFITHLLLVMCFYNFFVQRKPEMAGVLCGVEWLPSKYEVLIDPGKIKCCVIRYKKLVIRSCWIETHLIFC